MSVHGILHSKANYDELYEKESIYVESLQVLKVSEGHVKISGKHFWGSVKICAARYEYLCRKCNWQGGIKVKARAKDIILHG